MNIKSGYSIFMAVLFLIGTSCFMMVGCQKDYDGQLEIIRNQIKSGEINLSNLYSKVELMEEQIAKLQEALNNAETSEEHKKDIQGVLAELNSAKTELETSISELELKIKGNDEGLLDLKDLIETTEEQFNNQLSSLSVTIQGIDIDLDVLDGRVGKLEDQVKSLHEKQSSITDAIDKLKKEIEGLDSQEQIDALKVTLKQLEDLQATLAGQIVVIENELAIIKQNVANNTGRIEGVANEVSALQALVNNIVKEKNLATLDDLNKVIKDIDAKYAIFNKELSDLRAEYDKKLKELEELIESGSSEALKVLIDQVKSDVNALGVAMAENMADYLKTKSLVGVLDTRVKALEDTIQKHEVKLNNIDASITAIKEDIQKLFDRIQSMVIIPKYSGNYIAMNSNDGGGYRLTMQVDIRPFNVAKNFTPAMFAIEVKAIESAPTRAAVLPNFTIQSMQANEKDKTFTITAVTKDIDGLYRYSTPMDFQVALALNDKVGAADNKNNNRLSPFVGVYYVAPNSEDVNTMYDFYNNTGSQLKAKQEYSLAGFPDEACYKEKIASKGETTIASFFGITAKSSSDSFDVVECNLASVYDSTGKPLVALGNYVKVTSDGYIMVDNSLPGSQSLDGVRLIIGLQARKNSTYWGKRAYICVVLQNKD